MKKASEFYYKQFHQKAPPDSLEERINEYLDKNPHMEVVTMTGDFSRGWDIIGVMFRNTRKGEMNILKGQVWERQYEKTSKGENNET